MRTLTRFLTLAVAALLGSAEVNDWSLVPGERAGAMTATTDRAELESIFGADQVTDQAFYVAEGFCVPGVVVLKGTPDEADIAWRDGAPGVAWVRVARRDARWKTTAGIRVGTTLAELAALNGAAFTFSGFGWDYGGGIGGWSGGKLDETHGSGIGVRLEADSDALSQLSGEGAFESLLGDRPVRSDHPLAGRAGIRVTTLVVRLSAAPDSKPCEEVEAPPELPREPIRVETGHAQSSSAVAAYAREHAIISSIETPR